MGEIRIYTSDVRTFKQTEQEFIATVAGIVALALQKTELRRKLDSATKKDQTSTSNGQNAGLSLIPANFSHPSEEEFARLLDFYRIEWLYEPRSFPLSWQGDKVTEMFTPDFYLPELDIYIELTTIKQSLITEKNRKVRRLKELFPDINIRLLNKSDYTKILAKYGYGPSAGTKTEGINQVLFSQTQIQRRVRSLAKTISNDYAGQRLVLVGILKGVVCFMADLMQHISLPVNVEFMAISYYSNESETAVKITKDIDISISGQNVLMVEDIVDTGMTLNYILNHLAAHNPSSLRVCALLDKKARRLVNVPLDYTGFEVPDEFVVGYGLDYRGEYRNLPFIGILRTESEQIKTA
ncbi:MAG TPA: hypoxanthine phosphoribosyltransferase [Dehalococcoidia bacterium]|nr:hypoxanthine phosphoribosyltransferase [Dehalococcoidia bacterium]